MFHKLTSIGFMVSCLFLGTTFVQAQDLNKIDKLDLVDKTPIIGLEYFVTEKFESFGQISASWREAEFLSNDDIVYLQLNRSVSPGDRFGIFRKHSQVDDPMNSFSGGNRIQILGAVRIQEVKDGVIVGKIYNAVHDISRGSLIGDLMETSLRVSPQEPQKMVRGSVISPANPTNLTGSYELTFLNRGTRDGLRVNDMVYVYRKGTGGRGIPTSALPEVNVASLVIVHTSEKFSTAYNLTGIEQFEKGALFKSAMSDVRYLDDTPAVSSTLK